MVVFEIVMSNSNTNNHSVYAVSNKRAKLNLDSSLLWHCRLGHISKKHIEKLQHDGLLNSIDTKCFEKCVSCLSGKMARKPYSHQVERAKDLLRLIHTDSAACVLSMVPAKKVEKTPYEVWSTRTRHTPYQMCLNIKADEYEFGDLNKPVNYKAALLDLESDKWLNAMNVEMQSIKDNEVWDLVDLHPNGKTVGSKWLFKNKTDMDGVVHTYKARLVAKGFTQTSGID
uniref:Retrotransposon protein, putative, Ty1-copia subclass n=1 Tax=Tanacetum cinerariifolium TaxID=118510 RepID=A0A6L2K7J7_TANCI|nr:retrotransposon protein, putative, Ty1-copia subclass [Tanacetum cinerariifolium]